MARAAFSNDGKLAAYVEDGVLYVTTLVPGSRPVEVSREPWRFRADVRWFPDNLRLLTSGDSGTYILPALGGIPQRVNLGLGSLSISPDGRRALHSGGGSFSLIDLASRATRRLSVQMNDRFIAYHAFSPDGRLAAIVTFDGGRWNHLQVVSTETGVARQLIRDSVQLGFPNWDKATSSIVYLRGAGPAGQIWRQRVSEAGTAVGPPTVVIPRFDGYSFQLVDEGSHLFYLKDETTVNYFIKGLTTDTSSRRVTNDNTSKPSAARFSPDGRSVAFVQLDASGHNIFISPTDSIAPQQVTLLRDRYIAALDWAPDGRRIAFCMRGNSGPEIGVLELASREVAAVPAIDLSTSCGVAWISPEALVYQLTGNRNYVVHSMRAGPRGRLVANDTFGGMFLPALDTAHDRIAVEWNRRDPGLWLLDLRDSTQRRVSSSHAIPVRFTSDGETLFATRRIIGAPPRGLVRIRLGSVATADSVPVPPSCWVLDVLPDESKALCHVEESRRRDLWAIRDFDPARPSLLNVRRP